MDVRRIVSQGVRRTWLIRSKTCAGLRAAPRCRGLRAIPAGVGFRLVGKFRRDWSNIGSRSRNRARRL